MSENRMTAGIEIEMERAYRIALLLTASDQGAEFAVARAIEEHPDSIVEQTVRAAVVWCWFSSPAVCRVEPALERVLALPALQRHCFVLRILEGMPAGVCGGLLGLDASAVDLIATSAAIAHSVPLPATPAAAQTDAVGPMRTTIPVCRMSWVRF